MSLPGVHLLVHSQVTLLVETLATQVAVMVTQLHVGLNHVNLEVLTPKSAEVAAVVGACKAFPAMRLSVPVKIGVIR